jgi:hypothetical protein
LANPESQYICFSRCAAAVKIGVLKFLLPQWMKPIEKRDERGAKMKERDERDAKMKEAAKAEIRTHASRTSLRHIREVFTKMAASRRFAHLKYTRGALQTGVSPRDQKSAKGAALDQQTKRDPDRKKEKR